MSAIFGVWNVDGRPLEAAILDRMAERLRHRGADGRGCRISATMAIGAQQQWVTPEEIGETQPLVDPHGVVLAMDGRLDNRHELLRALGLPQSASDAACALAAYDQWGEQFAGHLNGDWAIAVFDPRQRRLLLARDAIGLRPLYYFTTPNACGFATEIKALLAHPEIPAEPDPEGVADFLLMSSRPLDRQHTTCFAGILSVEAAHVVRVTQDRISSQRYWDFDTGHALGLRSFEEYAEAFRERFREAVTRRMRSAFPVAVSLSGGLDSSSIFCEGRRALASGSAPCPSLAGISYTGTAGTDADETKFLADIERQYDVAIERFPMQPFTGVLVGIEEQIAAIEAPLLDYMWGVSRELHDRARRHGARVLLSGTWGDQMLFSSAYLVDLFQRFSWFTLAGHMREYRRWLGGAFFRSAVKSFAIDAVRQGLPRRFLPLAKRLRLQLFRAGRQQGWFADDFARHALRFAHLPATLGDDYHSNQARSIYLEARSKYHVHCMEWNNKVAALRGLDAALPFLDRDLIALMMAVPGEMQNWKGVPRALLREGMRGILPESVRNRAWKADFTEVVNTSVAGDLSTIVRALSPASLGVRFGFLDAESLTGHVTAVSSRIGGSSCEHSWDLADVYGLEVWLQVFFQESAMPRVPAFQESTR
jgi:asparagine synthase (glutamine-hydrolysing)